MKWNKRGIKQEDKTGQNITFSGKTGKNTYCTICINNLQKYNTMVLVNTFE
jgi:hypothetical protein